MRVTYPGFRVKNLRHSVVWQGRLQPSAMSNTYTVSICYRPPFRPKIHVLRPELRLHPGAKALPHVFAGNELCLYLAGEWTPEMSIADSIMQWISGWLYFYEVWYQTGRWLGGGTHPEFPQHKSG